MGHLRFLKISVSDSYFNILLKTLEGFSFCSQGPKMPSPIVDGNIIKIMQN